MTDFSFKSSVRDLSVMVKACWYPGEKRTRDYPGSDPECVILNVLCEGKDIFGTLTEKEIDTLQEEGFSYLEEAAIAQQSAYADHLIDLQKDGELV